MLDVCGKHSSQNNFLLFGLFWNRVNYNEGIRRGIERLDKMFRGDKKMVNIWRRRTGI